MPKDNTEKFKINFNPDQFKKFLHGENKKDTGLFEDVSRHSRDYQDVLGLDSDDTELMDRRQGRLGMYPSVEDYLQGALVKVEISGKKFGLIAKNTACHDYGSGWNYLIMAVSDEKSLNKSTGNGTAWINSIEENWHKKLIEAIRESGRQDNLANELFKFTKE